MQHGVGADLICARVGGSDQHFFMRMERNLLSRWLYASGEEENIICEQYYRVRSILVPTQLH